MITDINVSLSHWPFRRLPCDELPELVDKLRAVGVAQAWVGSYDGVLHKDIGGVNARLAQDCRTCPPGLLLPFGTVNPRLPDWREDLRRCRETFGMPGIRLHPNYHGYELNDPVFAELLTLAEQRGLIVQLVVRMEDPRMQHPLMQVPDVDTTPLASLIATRPKLRLILLNSLRTLPRDAVSKLARAGGTCFEISMLEGVSGISRLLSYLPLDRVLFGSHCPLFVLESAILKLRESELSGAQVAAVTHENALRLLQ